MNRFEQRLQKRLQNEKVAEGYQQMSAGLDIMRAIDVIRRQQNVSQEELASRTGKKREAIARWLSAEDINPTLNTLIELLTALHITADITLRQTQTGEGPIKVAMEVTPPQSNS